MTNLFTFTPDTPVSGDVIRAQHMRNVQNAVQQLMGIVTDSGTAITGVTTLNVGAFLCASGSASTGVTIYNRGINVVTPSGSVVSGNVINLLNGTNMLIGSQGSSITFHSVGSVSDANFTFTDIVTGNVSSLRHGFAPKSVADDYKFLNSASTPAYTSISGEVLVLNNSITNNVTSTKHGFAPVSLADDYKFLNSGVTPSYTSISGEVLVLNDSTTNNVSSLKHGFVPKSSGNQFQFLNSAGTPAFTAISGEVLTLYDSTINNFSTSAHGFVPKGTNVGYFLKDDGNWASPDSTTRFCQTGTVLVQNTATPTELLGAGKGSVTFGANTITAGKMLRIRLYGFYGDTSSPTTQVQVKIGSVVLCDTGTVNQTLATASGWICIEAYATCRQDGVTGKFMTQGLMTTEPHSSLGSAPFLARMRNIDLVTVDTTSSNAISVMWTWGTAATANLVGITNATIELLG